MPEAEIEVFPAFNSLQMLAHRLLMPYGDMRMVSLTGRPWHELDRALIEGSRLIGVLTDGEHTPARIASRLKYYGFDAYIIYIGEHLGNESKERVTRMTLEEASTYEAARPNCILLEGEAQGGGDQRRIRGRWPLQGGAGEEMGHWRP